MTPHESRKLQASVRKVRGLIKEYGDSLRTERDAALAEVERLKAEVAELRNPPKMLVWEVPWPTDAERAERDEQVIASLQGAHSALRGLETKDNPGNEHKMPLEYAHTWEQERAAVVAWLRDTIYDPTRDRLAERIEVGDHWPEGGAG